MSEFETVGVDPGLPAARKGWRPARWLIAGVAGLTGVAGLAAVAGLPGLHLVANQIVGGRVNHAAVGQVGNDVGGQDPVGKGVKGDGGQDSVGKGGGDGGTPVLCDPNDLIEKLTLANAGGEGTLNLARQCTYTLTANDGLGNGLPVIVKTITINGNDATIVRAANANEPAGFRIFNVGVGGDLTLRHLTVKGGKNGSELGGGGILVQPGGALHVADSTITHNTTTTSAGGFNGAGIANNGTTTVTHSTFSDNSANRDGAAISSTGSLTVEDSQLTYNNAGSRGGALGIDGGVAVINHSTIRNNNARDSAGGIYANRSVATINNSTISDNNAGSAGGILNNNSNQLTLRHSTVSRNTARDSFGGIINLGSLVIEDSAVTANTTYGSGGGIFNYFGSTVLRRSLINLNKAIGTTSKGGGIFNVEGSVTLTETRVTENSSTLEPGGVETTNNKFTLDGKSVIINNSPTNCKGSDAPVPNCFG
jgi:predicted outer membrane repeat protein